VFVHRAELAVRRAAQDPAEGQPRAQEVLPQADVEGDVAVVRVHVQPQVLALCVLPHTCPLTPECLLLA
jgi:hypothetical protein